MKRVIGVTILFFIITTVSMIVISIMLVAMFFIGLDDEDDEYDSDFTWGGEGNFAENEVPEQYIPLYKSAAKEYDLDWELLAAIHRVETRFSTIDPMVSHVGAEGHAQFMPCTWVGWNHPSCSGLGEGNISEEEKKDPNAIKKYGGFGVDANGDGKADMWNLEDAIYSMANYLSSNHSSVDSAILSYNHSSKYVNEVKHYMNKYKNNLASVDHQGSNVEVKGDKAWVVPRATYITSCYGQRWGRSHNGIDITAGAPGKVNGYDIVAFMDGTVSVSQFGSSGSGYGGYGNVLVLDHGNGVQTLYAHMLKLGVPVGKKVKAGDKIGEVGNTGASQGAHLHFEVRINDNPVNPLKHLEGFNMEFNPSGTNCPVK